MRMEGNEIKATGRHPIQLITDLSTDMASYLTETTIEILKQGGTTSFELAKILLEDAIRYDSIYPRARQGGDDTFSKALKILGNRC